MIKFYLGFLFAAVLAVLSPPPPTLADHPSIQRVALLLDSMKVNQPEKVDQIALLIERNK